MCIRDRFISNIGTLVEPTTKDQYYQEQVALPLGLYSHSDQSQQWMTGLPNARSGTGWGGKVADIINDMNNNPNISMNFSLSGTNVYQTGETTIEFSLDPVSYTHLRAHETPEHLVCRLL